MATGTQPNASLAQDDNSHNPNRLWNGAAKPLWNDRMRECGTFDSMTEDDLMTDNSILLMTTFCNCVAADPPIGKRLKTPLKHDTLKMVLTTIMRKFNNKFARGLTPNVPALFLEDDVKRWKKTLKDGKSRTLMDGDRDSELFKNCFPIPKQRPK